MIFVYRHLSFTRNTYFAYCTYILYVAEPPRITSHPQGMKDAVPGEPVTKEASEMWHSLRKD